MSIVRSSHPSHKHHANHTTIMSITRSSINSSYESRHYYSHIIEPIQAYYIWNTIGYHYHRDLRRVGWQTPSSLQTLLVRQTCMSATCVSRNSRQGAGRSTRKCSRGLGPKRVVRRYCRECRSAECHVIHTRVRSLLLLMIWPRYARCADFHDRKVYWRKKWGFSRTAPHRGLERGNEYRPPLEFADVVLGAKFRRRTAKPATGNLKKVKQMASHGAQANQPNQIHITYNL